MYSLYQRAETFARNFAQSYQYSDYASNAFPVEMASSADRLAHGQKVASVLQEWGAGPQLQSAGLLHSLLWGHTLSPDQGAKIDDSHVLFLCREYHRILSKRAERNDQREPHTLLLVNYFTLAYCDRDLALLGAADLWARYQRSKAGDAALQSQYQEITRQVLCPYLRFLGMAELVIQLQSEVDSAQELENRGASQNDVVYSYVKGLLDTHLPHLALHAGSITGHTNKAILYTPNSDSSSDAAQPSTDNPQSPRYYGLLVDSEEECYQTLYHLHRFFVPQEGTVLDSITHCEYNGYRALQTTVLHEEVPIHFEISTRSMDQLNRWGLVAVHLKDESQFAQQSIERTSAPSQDEAYSQAWWNDNNGKSDRIESAHIGTLSEILYVFSPDGKLHEFHRGCTVVDYAYSTDVRRAANCRRFLVNGEAVEPATVLHHLDLVDIEVDPTAPGPTRLWLSAASTPLARSAIDKHLKEHGEGIVHAQQILDTRLKELEAHYGFHISEERVNQGIALAVNERNLPSTDSLLAEISTGRLSADRVLHPLFASEILRLVQSPPELSLRPHQLSLAECCQPKPEEEIIGIPHTHEGVIERLEIHGATCPIATQHELTQTEPIVEGDSANKWQKSASSAANLIDLTWRSQPASRVVAQIEMRALDEERLLADAVQQLHATATDVILHRSAYATRNGSATARFVVEASNREVIAKIADSLQQMPGRTVDEVYQIDLPLSEQKELIQADSASRVNPYTRMPVYEEGMFFGRTRELNEIRDWLHTQTGIIWLVGQKRVGKTSLLLHLKNHFLDPSEYTPIYLDFQILHSLEPVDITFEIANSVYLALQSNGQSTGFGPPLRTMFEYDPMGNLIRYLRSAQNDPHVGRLVLLLDEFTRTTDAYRAGNLNESFFTQWRGLVQMTQPGIKFIVVVQQQAFSLMNKRGDDTNVDPSWHLMELGETQHLRPLTEKDARNLIEWPIRHYMQATPELLDRIHALTGSSPFLIQSFCFKLVSHMMQHNKRHLEWADLDVVRMELLAPTESIFAHLLDMIQGSTNAMCLLVAKIADKELQRNSRATPLVSWQQIAATYPVFLTSRLRNSLDELCERHILIAVEQQGVQSWRFSSILFQEWLALNVDEETKSGDL